MFLAHFRTGKAVRASVAMILCALAVTSTADAAWPFPRRPFSFNGPVYGRFDNLCLRVARVFGKTTLLHGDALNQVRQRGIKITRTLGEGGMGTVFEGTGLNRAGKPIVVVVKTSLVTPGDARATQVATDALMTEAQVEELLRPNTVTLVRGDDGSLSTVTESFPSKAGGNVPAPSLWNHMFGADHAKYSSTFGYRDNAFLDTVALSAVREMRALHAKGIIHNDIKPDNLLVQEDGKTRLIDFGLARRKNSSEPEVIGTLGFISRRGLKKEKFDEENDVFSMQQALLQIYARSYWKDPPATQNVVVRQLDGGSAHQTWREIEFVPELDEEGTKAPIMWALHSRAALTSADFEKLLKTATTARNMPEYLEAYTPMFVKAWKEGNATRREDLTSEMLRAPNFAPYFIGGLPRELRNEMDLILSTLETRAANAPTAKTETGFFPQLAVQIPWTKQAIQAANRRQAKP